MELALRELVAPPAIGNRRDQERALTNCPPASSDFTGRMASTSMPSAVGRRVTGMLLPPGPRKDGREHGEHFGDVDHGSDGPPAALFRRGGVVVDVPFHLKS